MANKRYLNYIYKTEERALGYLLDNLAWGDARSKRVQGEAVDFVTNIRKTRRKQGSLESFFEQYGLNTEEGLSLMALAEALLRVPDKKTANDLIRDKISGTDWLKNLGGKDDKDWMTRAAGLGLKLTGGTMNSMLAKVGQPVIREAMSRIMKIMGKQFVIGESLTAALKQADKLAQKGYSFSYDMLGEGARTLDDAQRYFDAYLGALHDLADHVEKGVQGMPQGISVKLSALHPRFELRQKQTCVPALTQKIITLCDVAAKHNLALTIDAEETARISLTLDIVEEVAAYIGGKYPKWTGFGLAVQAYQKAAPFILDHVIKIAEGNQIKLQVRLVKGAYWDTEIKHAQEIGIENYPVYTRKSNTDVSYLMCAQKMLTRTDALYPMFGTHNAHTVAAIIDVAEKENIDFHTFEFQKLFGMGDALYNYLIEQHKVAVRVYAPVGIYKDLLPYLVRRMLENGANSSFVNQIYNKEFEPKDIVTDPVQTARDNEIKHHPHIPLPEDILGKRRKNSKGIDLDHELALENIKTEMAAFSQKTYSAASIINGKPLKNTGVQTDIFSPTNHKDHIGIAIQSTLEQIDQAYQSAQIGHQVWSQTPAHTRAQVLNNMADLLEENRAELMSILTREGGKTIDDAIGEVREAVDFCRYYAAQGSVQFDEKGLNLRGPTGEINNYSFTSKGIFVCISPWNFPLAIFLGQITAALMAGNAVIAKPAEQTPLIAHYAINLLLKAGVTPQAINLLLGDGEIGAALIDHAQIDGVVFTGSSAVAKSIQRSLAQKEGAIIPLIAETGGQNAMIVDSSALTEQVIDDIILSAYGSAGQRCSACRILFIQEDVADKTITMLKGAMNVLNIGAPQDVSNDIGPIIDEPARTVLQKHKSRLMGFSKEIASSTIDPKDVQQGHYFAPLAVEIDDISHLIDEIFGPVLHVIRYKADEIDTIIDQINALGYGLTFGIHSRINHFIERVQRRIKAGNIYVNRGTTGAVVGVQPFGGRGLSGTGPKAGGPHYLHSFAHELVMSTDTTAAGGNTSLVMMEE